MVNEGFLFLACSMISSTDLQKFKNLPSIPIIYIQVKSLIKYTSMFISQSFDHEFTTASFSAKMSISKPSCPFHFKVRHRLSISGGSLLTRQQRTNPGQEQRDPQYRYLTPPTAPSTQMSQDSSLLTYQKPSQVG